MAARVCGVNCPRRAKAEALSPALAADAVPLNFWAEPVLKSEVN